MLKAALLVLALAAGSAAAESIDVPALVGVSIGPRSSADDLARLQAAADADHLPASLYALAIAYADNMHDAQRTGDANAVKTSLLHAVKTFKQLIDSDAYRNFAQRDTALFRYGYVLQSGKYMKEARAVYDQLLKNYPTSAFVPVAHLVFGDYFTQAGQTADAEARYQMVLKFPKTPAYAIAQFRLRKWLLAAQAFAAVATDAKMPDDRARAAALASAIAYRNELGLDADRATLAAKSNKARTPLSKTERALLDAQALYASSVAGNPELAAMRFVEAVVYRAHGDHAAAVPALVEYLRDPAAPGADLADRMLRESSEVVRSRSPRK